MCSFFEISLPESEILNSKTTSFSEVDFTSIKNLITPSSVNFMKFCKIFVIICLKRFGSPLINFVTITFWLN